MLLMIRARAGFGIFGVTVAILMIVAARIDTVPEQVVSTTEHVVDATVACMTGENELECARDVLQPALVTLTGAEVLEALSTRLSAGQCHFVGHVVGQELFRKHNHAIEPALAECSMTCNSPCQHGVIGEAYVHAFGVEATDFDPGHLNPDEIREFGTRLCTSANVCHGIGHGLFQTYEQFEPALNMCDAVSTGHRRYLCYRGVFMEYADIMSSLNVWGSSVAVPAIEDLPRVCDLESAYSEQVCFRYFPRVVSAVYEAKGESKETIPDRLRETCESFTDRIQRMSCAAGVGVNFTSSTLGDYTRSREQCARFMRSEDRVACTYGTVSTAVEFDAPKTLTYCTTLADEAPAISCFQTVFNYMDFISGVSDSEVSMQCGENAFCLAGARERSMAPWDFVIRGVKP